MSAIKNAVIIPAGTWVVDPIHTTVGFQVTETTDLFSSVNGRFTDVDGSLAGGEAPSLAGAVRVASLRTDNEQRDAHLVSPDFLEGEKYPEIHFASKAVEPLDDERFLVRGDLVIKDTPFEIELEAAGDPEPVTELKEAIRRADGLLIATPEYNRGLPGGLKNAIDWASRPALASPLAGKPVAIMGASTGRGGTARAQQQLREALGFSRAIVVEEPEVLVPEAFMRFDAEGRLTDERTREEIAELLAALAGTVRNVGLAAA